MKTRVSFQYDKDGFPDSDKYWRINLEDEVVLDFWYDDEFVITIRATGNGEIEKYITMTEDKSQLVVVYHLIAPYFIVNDIVYCTQFECSDNKCTFLNQGFVTWDKKVHDCYLFNINSMDPRGF